MTTQNKNPKIQMYVRHNNIWMPTSYIFWYDARNELPPINKAKKYNLASKSVLVSTEYRGCKNVIADHRYNYDQQCWEYLADATYSFWEPVHRGVTVEYWAYYPDPIIPLEENK